MLHNLAIGFPDRLGFIPAGFTGRGGIREINRDHPHLAVGVWKRGGKLYHALSTDKIDVEGRPARILPIGGPGDELSGFAQDGVVQGNRQGDLRAVERFHMCANALEEHVRIDTVLGVQIVMRCPIGELGAMGGDQGGDRVAPRTEQVCEQMVLVTPDTGSGARRQGAEF